MLRQSRLRLRRCPDDRASIVFFTSGHPVGLGATLAPCRDLCLSPRGARPIRLAAAQSAGATRATGTTAGSGGWDADCLRADGTRPVRRRHGGGPGASARHSGAPMSGVIAFQGVPGAYSDLACRAAYPGMTTLPCESFESSIDAVKEGRASLAMLPCENSLAGRVPDIHHLLPRSGLFVIAEQFQRVEHCLLGVRGAT